MDCSPPVSSVRGILQARTLEWVAISLSGDLPDPGVEYASRSSLALADGVFITEPPGKPIHTRIHSFKHLQMQKLNLV